MFRFRRFPTPTASPASLVLVVAALPPALVRAAPDPAAAQTPSPEKVIFQSDSLQIGRLSSPRVSPDGRWIVFSARVDWERFNLFVVPADGGEALQLTRGRFNDGPPAWAPDGRSVLFSSDRMEGVGSRQGHHLMRIPFDPETGGAAGIPRPVSLVPARWQRQPFVSPDGAHVAFQGFPPGEDDPGQTIVLVPLEGGPPRIVGKWDLLGWDADSEHMYARARRPDGSGHLLYRVSLDGSESTPLLERSPRGRQLVSISGDGTRFLWRDPGLEPENPGACSGGGRCADFVVLDDEGDEVGRIPDGSGPVLSPNDRSYFRVVAGEGATDVVVAPIAGGEPSQLRGLPSGQVLGWTRAGEVFLEAGGEAEFYLWNPATERRRPVELADASGDIQPIIHPDGRHVLYSTAQPGGEYANLVIHDLETGEDHLVSTRLLNRGTQRRDTRRVRGRGGHQMLDDGRFLFMEGGSDGTQRIRAVTPDGPVETLAELTGVDAAVHGDRVVWIAFPQRDGPGELNLFDRESGTTQTLVRSEDFIGVPVWSNDGRTIVMWHGNPRIGVDLAFFRLDDPGAGLEVKRVDPTMFYDIQWTPDDALLVMGAEGANSIIDTDVWIVDPRSDAPSTPLVSNPDVYVWGSEISPDGRSVATTLIRSAGSSLVRYEMDPPRVGSGGRGGRR